ncbi:hypothetical protein [Pedobacter cryoconitis]|uniref:hypothetical protein n=1 Tax=Pedobacter cryoconitis TaxID=188932 RepID=UPI00161A6C84|nr:hypothetical protein [Pedobacter cryoconitis]MBB5646819.1 putative transposase/invertase (TIGR01784 family) [Pedobacter cryoconitis]
MNELSPEQQLLYISILQQEEDDIGLMECKIERAEKEGLEKGKYETALAIARKMKEENFDLIKIAGFTSLSIEEIEGL